MPKIKHKTKAEYVKQYATILMNELAAEGMFHEFEAAMQAHIKLRRSDSLIPYIKYSEIDAYTDSNGNTPMHIACLYGHYDIADKWLEGGIRADIKNADGLTANDIYECTKKLGDLCRKEAKDIKSKIVSDPKYEIDVQELIQRFGIKNIKIVFNAQDIQGNTLLHDMALAGNTEMYDIMLAYGANESIENVWFFLRAI